MMGAGKERDRKRERGWRRTKEHKMGTGTETGRKRDGNGSSSGDENGDEDHRNGDGKENRIGQGKGEVKKRQKPHNNCRREQALSFPTRRHLCRQGVALAGTR